MNRRDFTLIAGVVSGKTGIRMVPCNEGWAANLKSNIIFYPRYMFYRDADVGFLLHEAAHLRFSSINHTPSKDLRAWVVKTGKSAEQIWALVNALEDARIEQRLKDIYPGAESFLEDSYFDIIDDAMRSSRTMRWYNPSEFKKRKKRLWNHYGMYWVIKYAVGDEYAEEYIDIWGGNKKLRKAIKASEDLIAEKLFKCKDTFELMDFIAEDLFKYYLPLCDEEEKQMDEQEQKEFEEQLKKALKELLQDLKKMIQQHQQQIEKQRQEQQQKQQQQQQGQGGMPLPQDGQQQGANSDQEQDQQQGGGSKDGDQEGNGQGNSQTQQNGQDEQETEEPQKGQGKGKEGQDGQPEQDKQGSEGEGEGEGKEKPDMPKEQPGEGEGQGKQQNEAPEPSQQPQQGSGQQPQPMPNTATEEELEEAEGLNGGMGLSTGGLTEELAGKVDEEGNFMVGVGGQEGGALEDLSKLFMRPPINTLTLEQLQDEVRQHLARVRKAVSILKDINTERFEGNFESGKLQNRKLYKVGTNNFRVFTRKIADELSDKDMAIGILVDESGSMAEYGYYEDSGSRTKGVEACIAAALLGRALELSSKPFGVFGFGDTFKVHKEFGKRFELAKMLPIAARHNAGTQEDLGIRSAAKELLKQPEKNKILIVINDGYPNDDDALRREIKKVEKDIKIYAIGIQSEAVKEHYKRATVVNNTSGLADELLRIFKENVGKRTR